MTKALPYLRVKLSKSETLFLTKRLQNIPFWAAYTFIVDIREYPSPPRGWKWKVSVVMYTLNSCLYCNLPRNEHDSFPQRYLFKQKELFPILPSKGLPRLKQNHFQITRNKKNLGSTTQVYFNGETFRDWLYRLHKKMEKFIILMNI